MITPEQTAKLITMTARGATTRDIEAKIGLDHSTVARYQQDTKIKALIEREGMEFINRGLRPARRTITRLAAMGNTKGADKDMLKLSLDASKHITSMAGLSGTTPSTIINALINVNAAPEQTAELNALQAFLQTKWQRQDVIDAEIQNNGISVIQNNSNSDR